MAKIRIPKMTDEELAEREEKAAKLNSAINERFADVIAEYAPKKQHKALKITIVILLIAAACVGIYFWVKHSQENRQFRTGVTIGGEFCIVYESTDGSSGTFELSNDTVLSESSRFAFKRFGGKTEFGRIYTPVSGGEVTLLTAHNEKPGGETFYEQFDITVDTEKNVTYTEKTLTEDEYREAAGLPPKKNEKDDKIESNT